MTFANLNLHPKILQAIEVCGYDKPTPVQSQSIPHILNGKDIMASAQTGTGKTAAYVLPGLHLLLTKPSVGKPRILILAPTRELAGQITKVIGKYSKFAKVNIASFVGGVSYHKQFKELSRPIDIIIATPGRLMDHMENKRLDLSHIEMLIVDEADRMLDMGFINDIKTIVQVTPKSRQTLLFSATADDKLMSVMKNLLKTPVKINISEEKVDTNLIKQKIHIVDDTRHKDQLLEMIIDKENIYKAIIFSATKRHAAKLALQLQDSGYAASPMHGDLKQNVRNKTLDKFRVGQVQFLVATDVAARGIDVTDISHVINYDLPKFSEDYVHRIGRTGRAGKTGVAISFALKCELHHLKQIERYIGDKIQQVHMTKDGEQERQRAVEEPSDSRRRSSSGGRRSAKAGESHGYRSTEQKSYRSAKSGESRERRGDEKRSYRSAKPGNASRGYSSDVAPRSRRSVGSSDAPRGYSSSDAAPRSRRPASSGDAPRSYRTAKSGDASRGYSSDAAPRSRRSAGPGDASRSYRSSKTGDAPRGRRPASSGDAPRSYRTAKPGDAPRAYSSDAAPRSRRSAGLGDAPRGYRTAKSGDAPRGRSSTAVPRRSAKLGDAPRGQHSRSRTSNK